MQYVGQSKRSLKTMFCEHFRKMKNPKKIDTFLYKHFRRAGHAVEKIIYKANSTERLQNIYRHEIELKWIKLLQTPFPLGFNDNIYHEGNISKMPDFDVFSLLDMKKRNRRSHGKRKNGNFKRKHKTVLTLSELNKLLKFGRHNMLSRLSSLSISSLRKLDEEANKFLW